MQQHMWLLLLLALGGINAKEPNNTQYETGSRETAEIEPQPESESEPLSDSGYPIIQPDLQNENAKGITELREKLENLSNSSKKIRRQALQASVDTLTGLSETLPELEASLSAIGKQQKVIIRLFRLQEEWRYWAADQVRKVMESTDGLRTAEAATVTEKVNNAFGTQLRGCAADCIRLQIRFNLDLAQTLDSLHSPTDQLIDVNEWCSKLRAKQCRKTVTDALEELKLASQNLTDCWYASGQVEESQSKTVHCMDLTLEEYTVERLLTEASLQGVVQDYRKSMPMG